MNKLLIAFSAGVVTTLAVIANQKSIEDTLNALTHSATHNINKLQDHNSWIKK